MRPSSELLKPGTSLQAFFCRESHLFGGSSSPFETVSLGLYSVGGHGCWGEGFFLRVWTRVGKVLEVAHGAFAEGNAKLGSSLADSYLFLAMHI